MQNVTLFAKNKWKNKCNERFRKYLDFEENVFDLLPVSENSSYVSEKENIKLNNRWLSKM